MKPLASSKTRLGSSGDFRFQVSLARFFCIIILNIVSNRSPEPREGKTLVSTGKRVSITLFFYFPSGNRLFTFHAILSGLHRTFNYKLEAWLSPDIPRKMLSLFSVKKVVEKHFDLALSESYI